MCRTYVLLLRFRYSFHRAIRGLDVFVVQCISTPWPNLKLQWSVRLEKSWLTAARQWLPFVTSPVRLYDVTTCSNFCSKHSGTLFTIRSFGALHIRLISILECTLACRGTHRLHLGHCHDPWGCGPLTIFRIRWLTASDPCRRGSRHNNVWSGVSRSGAANICSDEINLECWGLLTCGNCRPCRARLHKFGHLHSFITQLFCSFTVLLSPPLCLPFYTPYMLIAMISPIAWAISYPSRNYFLKLMHCTATARLPLRQSFLPICCPSPFTF